ncbi:hypothetical protein [Crateriforma conspicua]|uniref:hypothetical protein n=1 Tax=Crateriforma conspicua TaxID=2527996 RepID=UPI00118A196C|nr:hypothetical protein [Crateriforma conspicua]QDV62939.1 hypothetical protein Mal65_20760 [Crateriforma conspicua]
MTCDTQFRVTRPDLVGMIVACPNCGSMMQIEPPAGTPDPPGSPGQPPLADQPAIAVGRHSVDSDAITEASSIVTGDRSGPPPVVDPDAPRFEVDDSIPTDATANTESSAPPVPIGWENPDTTRRRQMVLVGVLAATGLCIAALLFVIFVRSWQKDETAQTTTPDPATQQTPNDDTANDSPASDDNRPLASGDADDQADPNQVDPSQDEPGPALPDAQASDGGDADPTESTDQAPEPAEDSPPTDDDTGGPSMIPDDLTRDPDTSGLDSLIPKNPLSPEAPPEDADSDGPVVVPRGDDADSESSGGPADLTGLDSFKPFLMDLSAPAPDAPPALQTPVDRNQAMLDRPADVDLDPMMVANPPSAVDLTRSMSIEFALARPPTYPMADYVMLISQLTGVPIEIDWVSFDVAGIDVRRPIKTISRPVAASEHFASIASQSEAMTQEDEALLRLTVSDEAFESAVAPITSTDDFGSGQASADEVLAEFLADPNEVSEPEANEDEPLVAPEDRMVWVRRRSNRQLAAFATDALRRMRSIAPKVPGEVFARWASDQSTPNADFAWRILDDGQTGPQSPTAMPIAQWLAGTARRNDASVLVHWTDAGRRQMSPQQLVLPHAGDGFTEMVRTTLGPFNMRIRQVSPSYWWVGPDARYDRLPIVIWTAPLTEAQQSRLISQLDAVMSDSSRDVYRRIVDPDSGRMLLMLPRFLARQWGKFVEP